MKILKNGNGYLISGLPEGSDVLCFGLIREEPEILFLSYRKNCQGNGKVGIEVVIGKGRSVEKLRLVNAINCDGLGYLLITEKNEIIFLRPNSSCHPSTFGSIQIQEMNFYLV